MQWIERLKRLGSPGPVETDLAPYYAELLKINALADSPGRDSDERLRERWRSIRDQIGRGRASSTVLAEAFALIREAAHRTIGLRPYDVQIIAAVALQRGKLVEMSTGEGKTLVAVLPAALSALASRGVHVLTFNDYLARRDAEWMGPVYQFLGLTVAAVQEDQSQNTRRSAYRADITYATAKQAGFDFLRSNLARHPADSVHRPFHFAIVDEADSILIDEARVPLVIAGADPSSDTSPREIARLVGSLDEGRDWETSEFGRNVELTERGLSRVEEALGVGDLHAGENYRALTAVNQALHAHVLLSRDVDYIVREGRIELVDEFTGRVVADRRWPDGLHAALEAKEGLEVHPGGRILGSITLQHFMAQYPKIAGMTATARPAAEELLGFYDLNVVPIPPNRTCIRRDQPDRIFTHSEARDDALVREIAREHARLRPVLVGTPSVMASERLARRLIGSGIPCSVLNARNDEAEAAIIADAGRPGAVTISTNMAGRGTDIRLGGVDEHERDRVLQAGGLLVIGTVRHESRRIDDQLRGRAGRQGDPGESRFFISLDDDLLVRCGIDEVVPSVLRPSRQSMSVDQPLIAREIDRLQRIAEGKNFEIRRTLWRYSVLVEEQRRRIQVRRANVLGGDLPDMRSTVDSRVYGRAIERFGTQALAEAERAVLLHFIDECWADHLAFVAHLREGIHLVGIGGLDPLDEFHKQIIGGLQRAECCMEEGAAEALGEMLTSEGSLEAYLSRLQGPSATWTYLVSDQVMSELQQLLFGRGNVAFAAGAVLMTWPVLAVWSLWKRIEQRRSNRHQGE